MHKDKTHIKLQTKTVKLKILKNKSIYLFFDIQDVKNIHNGSKN